MAVIDPIKQRDFAHQTVQRLRSAGYEALLAGGCVRDMVRGLVPKDYDVATSATPDQIRAVFGHRRTLAIGASFGVITVLGPPDAGQIEVATFRQDISYSDGRRPDAVAFSSAEEDARRRDFTINGLFYDPIEDRILDYVGGVDDLNAGVVRAIGDPHERFREDKLRLLRAVRFTATLDFELEPATRDAVRAMAPEIHVVSPERIAQEMQRMLTHERRTAAVRLLQDTGLLAEILPESKPIVEDASRWSTTLAVLDALSSPSFALALAALLHNYPPSPAEAAGAVSEVARRWRLSNHDADRATWLVENQRVLDNASELAWSKLQPILISPGVDDLLALHEARAKANGGSTTEIEYCREKLRMPPGELNPPPLITGNDLLERGLPQGPQYKRILDAVRAAQLDGKVQSKEEAVSLISELLESSDS